MSEEKEMEMMTPAEETEAAAEQEQTTAAPKKGARKQRKPVDPAVWDELKNACEDGEILSVKINAAVKAGVISYVNGVRGFIPASQLSVNYVENLDEWVGKTIDVKVITADPEEKRLVLSSKVVEQEKASEEKAAKLAAVNVGDIYDGKVEKIVTFGAFVSFADGLSGLVRISQMANKRIETPNEVVKVGDEVKVKVIGNNDGKIKLSMRAASGDVEDRPARAPKEPVFNYKEEGRATTSLGDMLKGIKLD